MSSGYLFEVKCPRCDGDVEHVTGSATRPVGNVQQSAVCRCKDCRVEWVVMVRLARVHPTKEVSV